MYSLHENGRMLERRKRKKSTHIKCVNIWFDSNLKETVLYCVHMCVVATVTSGRMFRFKINSMCVFWLFLTIQIFTIGCFELWHLIGINNNINIDEHFRWNNMALLKLTGYGWRDFLLFFSNGNMVFFVCVCVCVIKVFVESWLSIWAIKEKCVCDVWA